MKICPICEKKIEARWCRHCLRFVDPWILPDDIYINERHSEHEKGHCEYHDPQVNYDKQEYMKPGYENKIYGSNKRVVTRLHVSGNTKNKSTRAQKTAVFVIVIVVIYLVFGVISELGSYISGISDFFAGNDYDYENPYDISEIATIINEEYSLDDNYNSEYSFLNDMVPVSSEKSGPFIYEIYSTEDICAGGIECSKTHMDYELDGYIAILKELKGNNDAITVDFEKTPGECNNYVQRAEDGTIESTFWEDTYNSPTDFGGITISVDAATKRLHDIFIYSMSESDDFTRVAYDIINSIDESLFASEDELRNEIENVKKDTGYGFYYEGDYEYSLYTTTDGYISLSISPY